MSKNTEGPSTEEIAAAFQILRNFQDRPKDEIKQKLAECFPEKAEREIMRIVFAVVRMCE